MSQTSSVPSVPAKDRALKPSEPKPHIVLLVARGDAVRNFLYSDALRILSDQARVTLLSVIDDQRFIARFAPGVDQVIPLQQYREHRLVERLRWFITDAHFRWLWSEVARNYWVTQDVKAAERGDKLKRQVKKGIVRVFANRPTLRALTLVERALTVTLRPNDDLLRLFNELKPDLVFNTSHVHGLAAELPLKIAHRMGIPTAGFVFSWDNLTSRSRILAPYDDYLVWHRGMRDQLLDIYPEVAADRVTITGTPQFDYHFKPEFWLSREELCAHLGIDPARPFVFYTTGVDTHFPGEHQSVELVIRLLREMDLPERPQLVVRTYAKGTSEEMKALGRQKIPDVVFPEVQWDAKWCMVLPEDLAVYTSCLRHAALGINAASTVSLELMMQDKPVINLGMDPPGTDLPEHLRWSRHIWFDHYRPVAESGGVMVAWSPDDLRAMLHQGLTCPEEGRTERKAFIEHVFGDTLDGAAGLRVAEHLLRLARARRGPWK